MEKLFAFDLNLNSIFPLISMLRYFPVPYKDELLYSVIARYAVHRGIVQSKELVRDVFGNNNVAAVVDLPGHLASFSKQVEHLISKTPRDWIQDHTLYPAYFPFLPTERCEQLLASACGNYAGNVHTRIGFAAYSIKPAAYLKMCKACNEEHKKNYGELYWQRTLQFPGVLLCPVHHEWLWITNVLFHPLGKHDFIAAEQANMVSQLCLPIKPTETKKLITLASKINELLEFPCVGGVSHEQWSYFYRELASRNGLVDGSRINYEAIKSRLLFYWTKQGLANLDPALFSHSDNLKNIFRKHRKSIHPLRHLLLWQCFDANYQLQDYMNKVLILLPANNKVRGKFIDKLSDKDKMCKRGSWLHLRHKFRDKGVKWLIEQQHAGALYAWLYRNDRDWLMAHRPARVKIIPQKLKIDWQKRDREILRELMIVRDSMATDDLRERITKAWYLKRTSLSATMEKHLNKMPLCKQFVEKNVETIDAFQKRRILLAAKQLQNAHEKIVPWKLVRIACIRKNFLTKPMNMFIQSVVKNPSGPVLNYANLSCR